MIRVKGKNPLLVLDSAGCSSLSGKVGDDGSAPDVNQMCARIRGILLTRSPKLLLLQ